MQRNLSKIYILSILFLGFDQFIKVIVSSNMNLYDSFTLINSFLNITLVHNKGAAFGMFEGGRLFFILIALVTIILTSLFIKNSSYISKLDITVYSLLLGGIIGNLIDRIIHGYVIDYIDFNFLGFNFPIFNFADICIVLSIFLIIINTIREDLWN